MKKPTAFISDVALHPHQNQCLEHLCSNIHDVRLPREFTTGLFAYLVLPRTNPRKHGRSVAFDIEYEVFRHNNYRRPYHIDPSPMEECNELIDERNNDSWRKRNRHHHFEMKTVNAPNKNPSALISKLVKKATNEY